MNACATVNAPQPTPMIPSQYDCPTFFPMAADTGCRGTYVAKKKRRRRVDGLRWYAQFGREAVGLRVAEIAAIEPVEEVDQRAERHEEEVQLAAERAMLRFLLCRGGQVASLARLLQFLLELFCCAVVHNLHGLDDVLGRYRLEVLDIRSHRSRQSCR